MFEYFTTSYKRQKYKADVEWWAIELKYKYGCYVFSAAK